MVIIWLRTIAWAILRRWPDSFADRITAAKIFGVDEPSVVTEYIYVEVPAPAPVAEGASEPVVEATLLVVPKARLITPPGFKATFHDTLRRNDPHSPVSHVART